MKLQSLKHISQQGVSLFSCALSIQLDQSIRFLSYLSCVGLMGEGKAYCGIGQEVRCTLRRLPGLHKADTSIFTLTFPVHLTACFWSLTQRNVTLHLDGFHSQYFLKNCNFEIFLMSILYMYSMLYFCIL